MTTILLNWHHYSIGRRLRLHSIVYKGFPVVKSLNPDIWGEFTYSIPSTSNMQKDEHADNFQLWKGVRLQLHTLHISFVEQMSIVTFGFASTTLSSYWLQSFIQCYNLAIIVSGITFGWWVVTGNYQPFCCLIHAGATQGIFAICLARRPLWRGLRESLIGLVLTSNMMFPYGMFGQWLAMNG